MLFYPPQSNDLTPLHPQRRTSFHRPLHLNVTLQEQTSIIIKYSHQSSNLRVLSKTSIPQPTPSQPLINIAKYFFLLQYIAYLKHILINLCSICQIYIYNHNCMSVPEKKENNDPELQIQEEESSNLDYLGNQPGPEEASNSFLDTNKKKGRDWSEKESAVKRVIINNRGKQKKLDSDSTYDGVYLYKPGVELPSLYQFANQSIKIIIASQYIKRHNPELLKRNIYGTDPYTSNSDIVCILVHSGIININNFPAKRYEGIELTCKVIKPKKNYAGSVKNGLLSRALKGYNGNSLKPQGIKNLTSLGPMEHLERYAANMHIPIGKTRIKPKPRNISNIVPIPETHIVFNMNNQPAYKYSIFNIADKGFEKNEFMIKKLDNYVLYLQTDSQQKYELLKKLEMDVFDVFRFSKVKQPEKVDNEYFAQNKCPLEEENLEVLYQNLEWEEILWGNNSILIKGEKRIETLRSFKYYKREKDTK